MVAAGPGMGADASCFGGVWSDFGTCLVVFVRCRAVFAAASISAFASASVLPSCM